VSAQKAGYSGTPLAAKLGVKPGSRLLVRGAPGNYRQLLYPIPEQVTIGSRLSGATDIIHLFATGRRALEAELKAFRDAMRSDATIWVSWPKKASTVPTDITEDTVREIALPMGLVDVKVCAVTEVWSGLKLVIRKELR
jgi:hypothetical protein